MALRRPSIELRPPPIDGSTSSLLQVLDLTAAAGQRTASLLPGLGRHPSLDPILAPSESDWIVTEAVVGVTPRNGKNCTLSLPTEPESPSGSEFSVSAHWLGMAKNDRLSSRLSGPGPRHAEMARPPPGVIMPRLGGGHPQPGWVAMKRVRVPTAVLMAVTAIVAVDLALIRAGAVACRWWDASAGGGKRPRGSRLRGADDYRPGGRPRVHDPRGVAAGERPGPFCSGSKSSAGQACSSWSSGARSSSGGSTDTWRPA